MMRVNGVASRLWIGLLLTAVAGVLLLRIPVAAADPNRYWLALLTLSGLIWIYRAHRLSILQLGGAQQQVQQTADLHLATLEALANAIDAKDVGRPPNKRRLQFYAGRLAESVSLSPEQIHSIRTAALLHNIGKLAVPDQILTKPGPLTADEFQKMRVHPQIGAEIIGAVPFPYAVAPIIESHRERWDGQGYPHGLAGEQIPIGARILSVVNFYETLTSAGPRQNRLSHESAIGLLRHESGRALDPQLVDRFVTLLPQLMEEFATADAEPTPAGPGADTPAVDASPTHPEPATMRDAVAHIARSHRHNHAMYDIAQAMGTSLGIHDTMSLISAKLTRLVPSSGCALFLPHASGDGPATAAELRCRYASGSEAPRLIGSTLCLGPQFNGWRTAVHPTVVNTEPGMTFTAAGQTLDIRVRAAMVCPLSHAGAFVGAIALYHSEAGHYDDEHRRLLAQIAEQAGAVIHNAIVFEATRADSLTDPLTGLPNRRALFLHLTREMARANRLRTELAVVVIDLDEFKAINDTFGHHAGDRALNEVAAVLTASMRRYDLCARYGGDEFVVVLAECSRPTAAAKLLELQQRIAAIEIDAGGQGRVRIAASAGAAVFPEDGVEPGAVIAAADAQMYRDKARRDDRSSPPETSKRR